MILTPVKSSTISSIGHDGESTMAIMFNNGALYEYYNVPYSFYNLFINSESVGKFFAQHKGELSNYKRM